MEAAAAQLGLQVFMIGIKRADELPTAIESATDAHAGALFVIDCAHRVIATSYSD
jgi:hypothetical protein